MKKTLAIFLVCIIICALCACGQSEQAAEVDRMILAIGAVTLNSEQAIVAAEQAYANLVYQDQAQIFHYETLLNARAEYDRLVNISKAEAVDAAIEDIGAVDLQSLTKIRSARTAYDELSEDAKSYVNKYDTLETAERFFYDKLSRTIDDIGEVDLEDRIALSQAKAAYEALTVVEKQNVPNGFKLEEMEATYNSLKTTELNKYLKKMTVSADQVRGYTFYQSPAKPRYANTRSYMLPYIGTDGDNEWLKVRLLYTNDDWVFFESVTFAVDGKRYYKFFNYFDITRDNGSGDVWEVIDFSPTEEDIEMLWEIVNSGETIIRFQGDDYYYDLKVKQSDKDAIRDVLTAYELMQGL